MFQFPDKDIILDNYCPFAFLASTVAKGVKKDVCVCVRASVCLHFPKFPRKGPREFRSKVTSRSLLISFHEFNLVFPLWVFDDKCIFVIKVFPFP